MRIGKYVKTLTEVTDSCGVVHPVGSIAKVVMHYKLEGEREMVKIGFSILYWCVVDVPVTAVEEKL